MLAQLKIVTSSKGLFKGNKISFLNVSLIKNSRFSEVIWKVTSENVLSKCTMDGAGPKPGFVISMMVELQQSENN